MTPGKDKPEEKRIEDKKAKRYRLKSMVLARIFAEITVLLILINLPAVLGMTGYLMKLPSYGTVVLFTLCVLSALLLPAYAYITWSVQVDSEGLTAIALARKQSCKWESVKRIARRSNWNWVRYVVEHNDGELTFPIWLKDCNELIETVRNRLPKGAGTSPPFRKFSQDPISILFQCGQAALGVSLVVVFWFFFADLIKDKSINNTDSICVLVFCVIISAIFMWRTFVVILMPRSIRLTGPEVIVETLFFKRTVPWSDVLKIKPALPLLPDGFMLSTRKGSFLIGNGMDSADELVSAVKGRLEAPPRVGEKPREKPQKKKRHRK